METQADTDMAHGAIQKEEGKEHDEEMTETEKQFLKDLYVFMKKRDTPIERIPNLGFKQIDLFLMFKTVRDLGGYHQVTAQQLWKQVYNTLGGNPRSTSAATCTRRHYEKLLLPYECHMKGISMKILPHHQPKHYANYSKDDEDDLRPAKRRLLSIPLHQNLHALGSERHRSAFSLPLHYSHYYHPSPAVLPMSPPYVPISSSVLTPHSIPAPQPKFSFDPYPTERAKEPLEHLRYLAERYKSSSGLTEPLNLSVKASRPESISNPASSFAPPSSSKNPKFLNKPSPLYAAHCPQGVKNDGRETQDGETHLADKPNSYPVSAREAYVFDAKAMTASSSPTYEFAPALRIDEGATTRAQNPSSPETDFTVQPRGERERRSSPEAKELNLSQILPGIPRKNERGEMEIELPLSVFHNWLRLCRSSAATRGDKELSSLFTLEENSGQRDYSDTDVLHTNLTFSMNPQHLSSVAEDLRLRQRNSLSPTPTTQTSSYHCSTSQYPFTSFKHLPPGGILKNAASQDICLFDQQDINKSYTSKPSNSWGEYEQETPIKVKTDFNPLTVQQNFAASKEATVPRGKEESETDPSAVLMMNSSSTPLLHLTTDEVIKLKKIISSSS